MKRMSLKTKVVVKVKQKQTLKYAIYSALGISILTVILIIYFNSGAPVVMKAVQNSLNSGYSWKKILKIDNSKISGTIVKDYILLINESNSEFKNISMGGKLKKTDASDILFLNNISKKQCKHKIIHYNSNTGELTIKVKIDTLYSNLDNSLVMYFGNDNPIIVSDSIFNETYSGVWELEENGLDFSLNKNDAIKINNPLFCNAIVCKGMCLDGTKKYLNVKDNSALDLTSEGTIASWVKVHNYTNFAGIVHKGDKKNFSDEAYSLQLWNNNKILFALFNNTTEKQLFTNTQIQENIWYWIVATWNNSGMKIYVNGVLDNSTNQTLVARNTNGGLNIGAQIEQNFNDANQNFPLDGSIDQVMVLKSALTSEFIQTLFNNNITPNAFYVLGASETVSSTLPVEMGQFIAVIEGEKIQLNWFTYSEINNSYFTIEKSADGITYEYFNNAIGAGNSRKITSYTFFDEKPNNGANYYRLKQTDYDGNFEYCGFVAVDFEIKNSEFEISKIYPNPITDDNFTIEIISNIDGVVKLIVVNSSGNMVYQKNIEVVNGKNILDINTNSNLSAGNYFISVTNDFVQSKMFHIVKI